MSMYSEEFPADMSSWLSEKSENLIGESLSLLKTIKSYNETSSMSSKIKEPAMQKDILSIIMLATELNAMASGVHSHIIDKINTAKGTNNNI
jgi:hypothetical protein